MSKNYEKSLVLYDLVCDYLHETWDPIGVKAFGEPAGEYSNYVDIVHSLIGNMSRYYSVKKALLSNMKCSYQRNLTDVIFDYLSIKLDGVFKFKKIPIPFIYMNKIVIFVRRVFCFCILLICILNVKFIRWMN